MFNILITCKLFVGYISFSDLFMDHFLKKINSNFRLFFFILFYKNYHLVLDDQTSIIRFILLLAWTVGKCDINESLKFMSINLLTVSLV